MTCNGIVINIGEGTLSIGEDNMKTIRHKCAQFGNKKRTTGQNLQSLLESLLHISKVVKPTTAFLDRMLSHLIETNHVVINLDEDLEWF